MKRKTTKKLAALILAACFAVTPATPLFAETAAEADMAAKLQEVTKEVTDTANYLKSTFSASALSSGFYNPSRLLLLLLNAGIDCSDEVDLYLSEVQANYMDGSGDLIVPEPENYAYVLAILHAAGRQGTNFNGFDLVSKYEAAIAAKSQAELDGINPYMLPTMYRAIENFRNDFTDGNACLLAVKNAVLSYANENGIDYWGNSADNNGNVLSGLSHLYDTDEDIRTLSDHAVSYTKTLTSDTGHVSDPWMGENASSTATALALFASYGQEPTAALTYQALLTYKSASVTGGYTGYSGDPDPFSTPDALSGLTAYRNYLAAHIQPEEPGTVSDPGSSLTDSPPTSDPNYLYIFTVTALISLEILVLTTRKRKSVK